MTRILLALLALLTASPTFAAGNPVTLYDQSGAPLGTPGNALYVTGGTGGSSNGGGSAAAATTSNASDGQATSSTNQQNVVYNYLFNGTTWDRMRGTGGALNVFTANGAVETGGNLAAILARTPALGATTRANAQPVTIATDQPAITVTPNACTITQTVVTLSANTSAQLVAAGSPKDLHWQVTGSNPMTVSAGTTAAVVGQGINYQGAPGTGQGGGAENFSGGAVPTNAFQAISAAGTTATVWGCY